MKRWVCVLCVGIWNFFPRSGQLPQPLSIADAPRWRAVVVQGSWVGIRFVKARLTRPSIEDVPAPRPRGRPRKVVAEVVEETVPEPPKRGRPRKIVAEEPQEEQPPPEPAKRGRPRKAEAVELLEVFEELAFALEAFLTARVPIAGEREVSRATRP